MPRPTLPDPNTRSHPLASLPPTVADILTTLLAGQRHTLGDNLVAVYLRGSLVMGDFDPATSDVDFFAVTERPVSDDEFTALAALHARLGRIPNPYGDQLEGPYLDRAAAHRYHPGGHYPTIGRGEALAYTEHGTNWVLERWMVRERGLTLYGPDSRTLIAPVTPAELRAAVLARLPDWDVWATQTDDPEWQGPRANKAYYVETMCRALCTLATGELPSKPRAVAWALANLPEPWRTTVERSRAWRGDRTPDPTLIPEVARFVRWAAAQGEEASGAY